MPLINGLKMACEPCIRGHRSTKCSHANERLMIPVRKPGRPLSSCPHPPARDCNCGSVTAAIPRKQTCHCGPSSHSNGDHDSSIKAESPPSEAPSPSPTKAPSTSTTPSYRVQKSSAAKANGLTKSFEPANLERLDPSQVNVLPPYTVPQGVPPQTSGGAIPGMGVPMPRPTTEYGHMPPLSGASLQQNPMAFATYSQQPVPVVRNPDAQNPDAQNPPAIPTTSTPTPTSNAATGGGSCCSGGASSKMTPPTSTDASPKPETKPKDDSGSCCSSKNKPTPNLQPLGMPGPSVPPTNGVGIPPFQTPVANGQPMFNLYYSQPGLFTYPAHYGSYMSPLQPAQWKQLMETMQFGQTAPPAPNAFDMPMPLYYDGNGSAPPISNGSGSGSGSTPYGAAANGANGGVTSHMCTCGDTCQCIGCAAHPYNEATQASIWSAWNSMSEEKHSNNGSASGLGSLNGTTTPNGTNGVPNALPPLNAVSATTHGAAETDQHATGEVPESPAPPRTPSDAASAGFHEELPASDYFFVSYQLNADSCSGETASCPCGDECQCLGCSIHNNNTTPLPVS